MRNKLLTNRRSTRVQTRIKSKLVSSKRSQESIGMSFNMIFSIILIIFFLVAAFVAIKYFLGLQKEMQLRTYFESFQGKINEFGSSAGIVGNEYIFEKNAPSGTSALCYINFNAPTGECIAIKGQLGTKQANFVFSSSNYDKIMKRAGYKMITGISTNSLPPGADTSCFCIPVKNGKIKIKILTSTDNSDVKIESA